MVCVRDHVIHHEDASGLASRQASTPACPWDGYVELCWPFMATTNTTQPSLTSVKPKEIICRQGICPSISHHALGLSVAVPPSLWLPC